MQAAAVARIEQLFRLGAVLAFATRASALQPLEKEATVHSNVPPSAGNLRLIAFTSGSWQQLGSDIDGQWNYDYGGSSVALSSDGSRVATGARCNDGVGRNRGNVRVFEFMSGSWQQLGADIDGQKDYDNGGASVALSSDGSRVAIGAPRNDGAGAERNAGNVRVFEFTSGSWQQLGADINGQGAYDYGGWGVALSSDGSRVAIGAPFYDGVGTNAGNVRVFEFTSGSWQQLGADINGQGAYDNAGSGVALSSDGSRVAIGAPRNDGAGTNAGNVRVFEFTSGSWQQLGADIDGQGDYDNGGWSVALSSDGSRLAIGAPRNDGAGAEKNAGNVRVFEFTSGSWQQLGADINGQEAYDYGGWSVALSSDGSRVATGGIGANTNRGNVRVFEFTSSSWQQLGADINGEDAFDNSGRCVALSSDGSRVAIGAPFNDGGGIDVGNVRVFGPPPSPTRSPLPSPTRSPAPAPTLPPSLPPTASDATCGTCVIWGDPHIITFKAHMHRLEQHPSREEFFRTRGWKYDQLTFNKAGVFWLVKTSSVHVQGLYEKTGGFDQRSLSALAIGGPFLEGHVLEIWPLNRKTTWDGVGILPSYPSDFKNELVYAKYHEAAKMVKDGSLGPGIDLVLPSGVTLTVNRWQNSLAAEISMCTTHDQMGQCGSYAQDSF